MHLELGAGDDRLGQCSGVTPEDLCALYRVQETRTEPSESRRSTRLIGPVDPPVEPLMLFITTPEAGILARNLLPFALQRMMCPIVGWAMVVVVGPVITVM